MSKKKDSQNKNQPTTAHYFIATGKYAIKTILKFEIQCPKYSKIAVGYQHPSISNSESIRNTMSEGVLSLALHVGTKHYEFKIKTEDDGIFRSDTERNRVV